MTGSPESKSVERASEPGSIPGATSFSADEAERHAATIRPSWIPADLVEDRDRAGGRASGKSEDLSRELSSIRPGPLRAKATLMAAAAVLGFIALGGLSILSSVDLDRLATRRAHVAADNVDHDSAKRPNTDHRADRPRTRAAAARMRVSASGATTARQVHPDTHNAPEAPMSTESPQRAPDARRTRLPLTAVGLQAAEPPASTPVAPALTKNGANIGTDTRTTTTPSTPTTARSAPVGAGNGTTATADTAPPPNGVTTTPVARALKDARPSTRRVAPVVEEPPVARIPSHVNVQIATSPEDARLFIAGRRVSNPYRDRIRGGGSLQVTARAPGYGRRTLEVKLDRDRALAITLPKIRRRATQWRRPKPAPKLKVPNMGVQRRTATPTPRRAVLRLRPMAPGSDSP